MNNKINKKTKGGQIGNKNSLGVIRSKNTKVMISNSLKGIIHSEIAKKRMSEAQRGEKSHRWIKDRTKLRSITEKRTDNSSKCKQWRKGVKERDLFKCKLLSNECNGKLESHHIFSWRDYPELRYLISNGITLCYFHHPRKWSEEKRMIPIFQELIN